MPSRKTWNRKFLQRSPWIVGKMGLLPASQAPISIAAVLTTYSLSSLTWVGDFNARVGSLKEGREEWKGVIGAHGLGEVNSNGQTLLSFCAKNDLTIMNTCFKKKKWYKGTWQHAGTKKWHCIDYVIMRRAQRRLCTDARVFRGAQCWTDHNMLGADVQVIWKSKWREKAEREGKGGSGQKVGGGPGRLPLAVHRMRNGSKEEKNALKGEFAEAFRKGFEAVSYTHLRAHETREDLVCRLLLEKKK